MKITLINKTDSGGGAAMACRRLLEALQGRPVSVNMLVQQKTATDSAIQSSVRNLPEKLQADFSFLYERLSFMLKERDKSVRFAFSTANAGTDISEPLVTGADILHLHWVNGGFLSLKGIRKILQAHQPVVWTLHDMWPFTGGCHYPGVCNYFTEQCGNCYFLKHPHESDISRKGWQKKGHIYRNTGKLTFVACSNWMRDMARQSALLQNFEITTIPNALDIHTFSRQDKALSRRKWQVPGQAKIILFGAANIKHTRKGINYLIKALHRIRQQDEEASENICVVIFGKSKGFDFTKIPFPVISLPVIQQEADLAEIYSLADVFVLPSLEDNLPNMVMEALSCATPVVAFNTGGIPDMVEHDKNGYLSRFMDPDDLANGILTVLGAENDTLSINARKKVVEHFSYPVIAQKHLELYERLLQ